LYPELLPGPSKPIDSLRQPFVPAGDKRNLLDHILREVGAVALLAIGGGLRDGDFDPIWRAATKARDPKRLFNGWRRLEGYAHSTNRLEITWAGTARIDCRRYAVGSAKTPGPSENFLICGIVVALLEIIGCREIICIMPQNHGGTLPVYENGRFHTPDKRGDGLDSTAWTLHWSSFEPRRAMDVTDGPELSIPLPATSNSATRRTVVQAARYLSADFLHQWKVGELARELGMSQRSFQRRLGEAGLNFSGLVRGLRIQEACRLFEEDGISLAAVGFCAGFSDSAHFSRDFRAGTGATPTAFRDALGSR
jgi:AraC-like DNA-binding protein